MATVVSPRAKRYVEELDRLWAERPGVLGMSIPTARLEDEEGMQRLDRFASLLTEVVVTKTMYGDSIVRLRRTSQMSLAAEVQWSLLPPLTFANHFVIHHDQSSTSAARSRAFMPSSTPSTSRR